MEGEASAIASECEELTEDVRQIPEEVPLPLPSQNGGSNCTEMGSEDCPSASSSQTTPKSPKKTDQSGTPNLIEKAPLPSQSDDLESSNKSTDVEGIIPSNEDTTPCLAEVPLPFHNKFSVNTNLNVESKNYTLTPISQSTTPCPVKVSISVPTQFSYNNNLCMESEDCTVTLNSHDTTPFPVEVSSFNQDEGASGSMTPARPSHLVTTDNLTNTSSQGSNNNLSKSRQKVKKGVRRNSPSASKGIQTSFHLLDSNSTFRDRIVDLDTLRRETGVVCVEDLQDLDVTLEEWPMLLVSQLRLRDTIINNLNGIISELVECGQVMEQDLDYLKLKILELQQETKKRTKEDQQGHRSQWKETETQTTEEDFAEAWNRWYYGCWGDYYSESDPTSSMYWPGHYMKQTTVASRDNKDEDIQQQVVEKEQVEDMSKVLEEVKSEKDSVMKSKEKESSHAESATKSLEKRKKLKGKRKNRHESEKPCKEPLSEEKEDTKKPQDADKKMKNKEKEKDKREKSDGNSETIDPPVITQPSQDISSTTSTTELNGTEEEEGRTHGWDISQSITHQVATVAAQAVVDSGYIFQEELGLYYDYNTGYYYNAENGLYYDTKSGTYFYYDHTTKSYQFHSQVSPTTTTNNNNKRRKRKTAKKESTKSSSKNEDTEEKEEGECTESDDEGQEEVDEEEESEEEEGEEGDTSSPNHHEEALVGDIPPSLRLMVVEGGERVPVGDLHVVTLNGGTVGREATNDVHLPDLNVSKVHALIEYRSTGADDHHYFLQDLGSNNGTFVNGVRLCEARQASKQVEVGHGWEVQFGPIKVKCHLHPGNLTCNECEPGLVLHTLPSSTLKPEAIASFKNAKSKERARRKELKAMQKKYKLTHRDPQSSSSPAAGYTDRTLLRQAEKGSDNPYEKTEVASSEIPLKETSRGFALLQKMGWSQGQGLGKTNSGRTEPVKTVSVVGKAGLGSSQPSVMQAPDPWTERRRKQLQITQERYKQSTAGH